MLYRYPSMHVIHTCGPKVCKYYLHRAIWIHRDLWALKRRASLGSVCSFVNGLHGHASEIGFTSLPIHLRLHVMPMCLTPPAHEDGQP